MTEETLIKGIELSELISKNKLELDRFEQDEEIVLYGLSDQIKKQVVMLIKKELEIQKEQFKKL